MPDACGALSVSSHGAAKEDRRGLHDGLPGHDLLHQHRGHREHRDTPVEHLRLTDQAADPRGDRRHAHVVGGRHGIEASLLAATLRVCRAHGQAAAKDQHDGHADLHAGAEDASGVERRRHAAVGQLALEAERAGDVLVMQLGQRDADGAQHGQAADDDLHLAPLVEVVRVAHAQGVEEGLSVDVLRHGRLGQLRAHGGAARPPGRGRRGDA
mmetsp:Transcript_58315/g.126661  ORF Transcript_58315/g.126661 Transcript_58315/m.126661 type:complete len:212 (+) Transcript_58315:168-803(+)